MHGNVVTLDYKSPDDLREAVAKLEGAASQFDGAPGFIAMHMVQTSPTQTVHTVVFDTEAHLMETREKMFPVLVELTGPHVTGPPQQHPGPVVLHKATHVASAATTS